MPIYRVVGAALVELGVGQVAVDDTPPTVPGNIRTLDATDTTVTIAWDPSSDGSGSGLARYDVQLGTDWAPNALATTRQFTGLMADTQYVVRVRAVDNAGNVSASAVATIQTLTSTPGVTLFAGHVPNRVLVGMATPQTGANSRPGWAEARQIIGQPIYEGRRFTQGTYSASALASMLAECDAAGAYPVLSFKYGNWAGVAAGSFDADLVAIANAAKARRTSGPGGSPQPFALSFHHEPAGDGDLADWAAMQTYCTWYFAGRGGKATGSYDPAGDVTDIMAWAPIGNGFWWRASSAGTADAAAAWPQTLIDALRINRGIILNDFYDCDYVNQTLALTDVAYRTPGSGVRTSKRISNFLTWARAHNTGAVGCGEFGVIDGPELTRCWQVMRANRDIWAVSNYFNSQNNSDHEWRVVPANYPAGNPTGSKGLVDFGGDAQSAGRLDAFQTMLTESVSPQYTSPL